MWQEYTYSAPLLVDGKDILDILDREDDLISKNVSSCFCVIGFAMGCVLRFFGVTSCPCIKECQ